MLRHLTRLPARRVLLRTCQPAIITAAGGPTLAPRPHPARTMRTSVAAAATGGDAGAPARPVLTSDAIALRPDAVPTVALADGDAAAAPADLLLVGVWSDDVTADAAEGASVFSDAAAAALDASFNGLLSDIARDASFSGAAGASTITRAPRGAAVKHVGVVGLGKKAAAGGDAAWGASPFAKAAAALAAAAKGARASSASLVLTGGTGDAPAEAAAAGVARGAALGAYEATRFKKAAPPPATDGPPPKPPVKLTAVSLYGLPAAAGPGLAAGAAVARGTLLARYLVEAPPNVCTPAHLARAAADVAAAAPAGVVQLAVLERDECEEMGMGCYLGVAACSELPPKFIHLTIKPQHPDGRSVALVGKGLTFDSGGYNIKTAMMESMKFDMGGSAAVLGAADALASLAAAGSFTSGPTVHVIVAACENMIDGKGMRPGDILTAANGTTVEINNTDAEGRLTLADALWFAQEKAGATAIVDVATLTGACMVALGPSIAGVMGDDDDAGAVLAAARRAGEKAWRLPLDDAYADQLKSPIADMKNAGARFGGAITAGLFLKRFINDGVKWAHVDIAGPAWDDKDGGATGYGVATLVEWVVGGGGK